MRDVNRFVWTAFSLGAAALAAGCGSDSQSSQGAGLDVLAPPQMAAPGPDVAAEPGESQQQSPPSAMQPPAPAPGAQSPPAPGAEGAAGDGAQMPPTAQQPPATEPPEPAGPDDGDPSAPVVETADVPCGGPSGGFGRGSANFMLGGRQMIVTYPCGKHAGAPMTFFLNLHGTTPVEQHFYQHGYFSIHNHAESHNIIVVTPSSVVQQWGNGDDGRDEPHLMEIIDWVYSTFHGEGKFDIRGMWVGGHSWGAMYTTSFVCKPELADKVAGAVIMSGVGRNPACASSISVISSAAEDDIGPVVNQGSVPSQHGCGAEQQNMLGNNEETHWPDCDAGYVHANYFMLGKSHISSIDGVVVERIADLINVARR